MARSEMAWVGLSVGVLLLGCTPKLGRAFDNSSVDFNGQNLHRFRTPGDPETVADAVVTIMEASGASLVKRRDSSRGSVILSFRVAVERVVGGRSSTSGVYSAPSRWFRAGSFGSSTTTTIDYVAYGALFYFELVPIQGGVELEALGLPVIDGVTACPLAADAYRDCRPMLPRGEAGFAENVQRRSGISVSGAKEAEVISGVWAQLKRKRWQDVFRSSLKSSDSADEQEIDSAFSTPAQD